MDINYGSTGSSSLFVSSQELQTQRHIGIHINREEEPVLLRSFRAVAASKVTNEYCHLAYEGLDCAVTEEEKLLAPRDGVTEPT